MEQDTIFQGLEVEFGMIMYGEGDGHGNTYVGPKSDGYTVKTFERFEGEKAYKLLQQLEKQDLIFTPPVKDEHMTITVGFDGKMPKQKVELGNGNFSSGKPLKDLQENYGLPVPQKLIKEEERYIKTLEKEQSPYTRFFDDHKSSKSVFLAFKNEFTNKQEYLEVDADILLKENLPKTDKYVVNISGTTVIPYIEVPEDKVSNIKGYVSQLKLQQKRSAIYHPREQAIFVEGLTPKDIALEKAKIGKFSHEILEEHIKKMDPSFDISKLDETRTQTTGNKEQARPKRKISINVRPPQSEERGLERN